MPHCQFGVFNIWTLTAWAFLYPTLGHDCPNFTAKKNQTTKIDNLCQKNCKKHSNFGEKLLNFGSKGAKPRDKKHATSKPGGSI